MKPYLFITLFFFLSATTAISQNVNCPPNIDFETGNLSFWECSIGNVDTLPGRNVITLHPSPPTVNRHEIIDSALEEMDPYGNFPKNNPYGGRYSVKLGNNQVDSQAEGISYTFMIPSNADTFSLTYYYAVVFEDPGHTAIEQPRFFVSAYDVLSGRVIDCASYNYISNGSIPGFKVSESSSDVLYKEWTPSSIDFSGLAGRMVRLEFKTADCTRGGHFGYAYLDVGTGCGGLMAVGAYCIETNSVTLNAPYGFKDYTWYNNNYTTVIGTTRTVSLTPPPPINSYFHVDMVPYPGFGCRDTADATLIVLPVPAMPEADSVFGYCQYDFAFELTARSLMGYELIWYTSSNGLPSTSPPIPSTAISGVFDFWVTQKRLFGCESPRKKISVTISPTPTVSFSVNDLRQCQAGNNFIFTSTSTNIVDTSIYQWDFGDGTTGDHISETHVYTNPGRYFVTLTVTNPPVCSRQITRSVDVIQKPMAVFSFPSLICENETPIVFQNNSYTPGGNSAVTAWWWKIGNSTQTVQLPQSFVANGGPLTVKLVVTNTDGCPSDTNTQVVAVHYSPVPAFSYAASLCDNEIVQFKDISTLTAGFDDRITTWNWKYDNVPASTQQHPATILPAGVHHVFLQAETDKGCKWRTADSVFTVYPKPGIALYISDSCVFRNIVYTASTTTAVQVSKWLWDFGYGLNEGNTSLTRRFTKEDYNPVKLIGQTIYHCKDTIIRPFTINYNRSRAERDTTAAKDEPVQLITSKAANILWYKWSPSTGLNSTTLQNPIATYDQDQLYELNTLTKQGCDSYSKVFVKRYKGPDLYVASAFSPNADSRNDVLHILPIGIRSFNYFRIFNRRGQMVFETTNYYNGWDGTYKGAQVDPENYVWMAMATDYKGNVLFRKGNVILLR